MDTYQTENKEPKTLCYFLKVLYVTKHGRFFSRPLGDVAVDEGQKLRITTPVKANPVPTFAWTKDGKPIDPKRVHFFSDGELVSACTNYRNSRYGGDMPSL